MLLLVLVVVLRAAVLVWEALVPLLRVASVMLPIVVLLVPVVLMSVKLLDWELLAPML